MAILRWLGNFFNDDDFDEKKSKHGATVHTQLITALVKLKGQRYQIKLPSEANLLKAMKRYEDMDIPHSCEDGVCTSCKVKLINGKLNKEKQDKLSPVEQKEGYVLACQCTISTGDIELDYDG